MGYLIGTDEAGYGPNLGPLVVAATAWHLPETAPGSVDLYDLLRDAVVRQLAPAPADCRVPIADSKLLYRSGGDLCGLEAGLFPALAACGTAPTSWQAVWKRIAPCSCDQLRRDPWYQDYECCLPLDSDASELQHRAARLAEALRRAGARLLAVRAVAVFPRQFNQAVDQLQSKGAVLSQVTLDLVHQLIGELGAEPLVVHCDKHGGRNYYGPMLQCRFPEFLVEIGPETRQLSVYRWGPPARRVEFRFAAHGESFLPSALASMTAKYLRELAMRAFNAWWQQRIAGLRPTAGYPEDAHRFLADINTCCRQLEICHDSLWRKR